MVVFDTTRIVYRNADVVAVDDTARKIAKALRSTCR